MQILNTSDIVREIEEKQALLVQQQRELPAVVAKVQAARDEAEAPRRPSGLRSRTPSWSVTMPQPTSWSRA